MIWTLNKAIDDILDTLDRVSKNREYKGYSNVKDISVLGMQNTEEFFIFKLKMVLGDNKEICFNRKYTKEKEKLLSNLLDDD